MTGPQILTAIGFFLIGYIFRGLCGVTIEIKEIEDWNETEY